LSSLPCQVCNVGVILKIIKKLSVTQVCIGNCGDKFQEIAEHKNGKFLNLARETVGRIDSHEIAFRGETIFNTIRHVDCAIFVDTKDGQCKKCKTYQPNLRAMYNRYKQTQITDNLSSSKTLDIHSKLKECQARLQVAEQQLTKAQQVLEQYVEVDEEIHNDLLTIMNENAVELCQIIHLVNYFRSNK